MKNRRLNLSRRMRKNDGITPQSTVTPERTTESANAEQSAQLMEMEEFDIRKLIVPEDDYTAMFLQKKPGEPRRQTYISARVYDKIMDYLPVVAGQFSITNYLDNILCHHLEKYGDEINDLYDKNYRKPF